MNDKVLIYWEHRVIKGPDIIEDIAMDYSIIITDGFIRIVQNNGRVIWVNKDKVLKIEQCPI